MHIYVYICTYIKNKQKKKRNKQLMKQKKLLTTTITTTKENIILYVLLLQRNSYLPSVTAEFLSLPSATANIPITHKTFSLIYPCIDNSKYKTHPRYRVIIAYIR